MLRIEDLTIEYTAKNTFLKAVDNVSFAIRENETFALIGESGCGKTSLALSLFDLIPGVRRSGTAFFGKMDLFSAPGEKLRGILGREVGFVFQNPYHAFDPVYRVGWQIAEALDAHHKLSITERRSRVRELLEMVELENEIAKLYPHELSGGMLQRAQLASALCCSPPLLIADEPTSSLDVTIQAQIIDLLNGLKLERKLTLFIITHDLGIAASIADSVAVMNSGKIVEYGTAAEVLSSPQHPYTKKLLKANGNS